MKESAFFPVEIIGTGSYIPSQIVDNITLYERIQNFELEKATSSLKRKGHELSQKTEAEIFDLWVIQVSGIKSRPFISSADSFYQEAQEKNLFVEHMGKEASMSAIEDAGINKDSIDHVIFSTYSSNRIMPSAGVTLANLLGINKTSAVTLNGACSGFLDALIDAVVKIKVGQYKNILVVASEQLSDKMNYQDPKTAIIFGDGAGAFVVRRGNFSDKNDKNFSDVLGFASEIEFNEQVYMERKGNIFFNSGPLVERNAVRTMQSIASQALEKSKQKFSDIDYIIPHQANLRILLSFQQALGLSPSQVLKKIETYGNLSSASVPVTLDYFLKSELKHSNLSKEALNLLLISVGGGYTFSALSTRLLIR